MRDFFLIRKHGGYIEIGNSEICQRLIEQSNRRMSYVPSARRLMRLPTQLG